MFHRRQPSTPSEGAVILGESAKAIATEGEHPRSILLIEHDPDLQWQLARMLTVHGNRVVGTSTGEGALTLAERWQADIILVANDLPGQSGLEVAKSLRARYPNTPVVLMAEEHPDIQVAARLAGAAACLIKPFRFDALRALIDSMQLAPIPAE